MRGVAVGVGGCQSSAGGALCLEVEEVEDGQVGWGLGWQRGILSCLGLASGA